MLASFDKGGLEIGSLKDFNLALLQKWRWCFSHNTNSLWVHVIKVIHGDEAGFELKGCNSNGIWSSIISSYSNLHTRDIIPSYYLCCKVGDGGRNVAALDVMVSKIGNVSFNNWPDAWSWKILDNDSFSVQAMRSHIGNCFLPSLSPTSIWSKLIPHRRDEMKKIRLDHLKQDQEMLVTKILVRQKKVFRDRRKCEKIHAKRSDFLQGME
nr:RNA-directed DNA polymerase, eukaryota, reverse transcriptase zinc-binding domain protein [Tanacetum cinerariifolium]